MSAAAMVAATPASPAQPVHALFCFDVLYARLAGGPPPDAAQCGIGPAPYPLFVTWNLTKSGRTRLRGCIGNFSAMPLASGLRDYSLISALKDHRFPPISLRELPRLTCAVSLLHTFEPCADHLDWTVGLHGIRIHFPDPALHPPPDPASGSSTPPEGAPPRRWGSGAGLSTAAAAAVTVLSACYLPDIAPEQGWTRLEAVDSAIRKAGYDGPITDALRGTLRVERYQSSVVSQSYDQWAEHRGAGGQPVAL